MNKETELKVRSGHLSIVILVLAAALLSFVLCGIAAGLLVWLFYRKKDFFRFDGFEEQAKK